MKKLFLSILLFSQFSFAGWEYLYGHEGRVIVYDSDSPEPWWSCLRKNPKSQVAFSKVEILSENNQISIKIFCDSEKQSKEIRSNAFYEASQFQENKQYVVQIKVIHGLLDLGWINQLLEDFSCTVPKIGSEWKFLL